jgi:hypothetical protein
VSGAPIAESLAGYLIVYVVFPLTVLGVIGGARAMFSFHKRLNDHTTALAILVRDVNPPDDLSLRQLIRAVEHKADENGRATAAAASDLSTHIAVADERWNSVSNQTRPHPGGTS